MASPVNEKTYLSLEKVTEIRTKYENTLPPLLKVTGIHRPGVVKYRLNSKFNFEKIEYERKTSVFDYGNYGDVYILKQPRLAVKTFHSHCFFTWELALGVLIQEHTRPKRYEKLREYMIKTFAYSCDERSIVMELMQHSLSNYMHPEENLKIPLENWPVLVEKFHGVASALKFINRKCGITHLDVNPHNLLLNLDPVTGVPSRMAICDLSIAAFNSAAPIKDFRMTCARRDGMEGFSAISESALLHGRSSDYTVRANGYNRPTELLVDYLNGLKVERRTLTADEGEAIDLYGLGTSLLQMIMATVNVNRQHKIPAHAPMAMHEHASMEYTVEILAYRIALEYIFGASPLENAPPPELMDQLINESVKNETAQKTISTYAGIYLATLREHNIELVLPSELAAALLYARRLCHFRPELRGIEDEY